MKRNFIDNVIMVTGASGNLGRAICMAFAKAGAKIVALDLNKDALLALQEDFMKEDIEILPLVCDITDKSSCKAAADTVIGKFGRINALVNNAGITHIERYTDMDKSKEITRRIMEVNFFGAVNCTEVCLDEIRKNKGFFVNISSVAGFAPLLGRTAYAASKHALHGFFESLHSELRDEGVHSLMVCPSFIQAPVNADASTAKNSIYQNKKTIGKDVSPDDIAKDILSYCIKNKPLLVSGKTGRMSYFLRRFLPGIYFNAMCNKLKNDL